MKISPTDMPEVLLQHAQDCALRAFHQILPDFLYKGEDQFKGMERLARDYDRQATILSNLALFVHDETGNCDPCCQDYLDQVREILEEEPA
jgi:hypothetical protein